MAKQSVYYQMEAVTGKRDAKHLKQALDGIRGVISVAVNQETNTVAVDYDDSGTTPDRITACCAELGFHPTEEKQENHWM